jgi:hypothetical protein
LLHGRRSFVRNSKPIGDCKTARRHNDHTLYGLSRRTCWQQPGADVVFRWQGPLGRRCGEDTGGACCSVGQTPAFPAIMVSRNCRTFRAAI